MSFAEKRIRIRDHLITLLKEHPDAKSDYRKLVQYYWYYVDGLNNFIPKEKLVRLTPPESITRAFRKLVEDGVVEVPAKVRARRNQQEHLFQEYYRKNEGIT